MIFLLLLIVPLVVFAASFILLKTIDWKEVIIMLLVQSAIVGISALIISYSNTHDVEVWNGVVSKTARERVSCSHSYSCHCRDVCSGSGKDRSCHNVCDTCYEHSYDFDYAVYSNIGDRFEISRVDRQGLNTPPRFSSVVIGEPTVSRHSYVNYIKADPQSVFRHQGIAEKYFIPAYPENVYDYYRLNRFINNSKYRTDSRAWNDSLSILNGKLGPINQSNVIVLLTEYGDEYIHAIEEAWIGGKKNDIILIIGVDSIGKIQWSGVIALTDNQIFQIKLRDEVMALGTVDHEKVMEVLSRNVMAHYRRKPMSDFEYLNSVVTPTQNQWIVSLIFSILSAVGLVYLFHRVDISEAFERKVPSWERRRRF